MNLPASTSSRVLSGSVRALAHLVAGLESLGVIALFLAVTCGVQLPDFDPEFSLSTALIVSLGLTLAYLLGLIVDGLATNLWAIWNREDWGEGALKPWARRRTNAQLLFPYRTDRQTALQPWLSAQRWIWKSPLANKEFGDLRFRMMVGKDTALNVAVGILVCAVSLLVIPSRAYSAVIAEEPWVLLGALSIATGVAVTRAQCRVLKVPGFGVRRRLRSRGKLGPNWGMWWAIGLGFWGANIWWYLYSVGTSTGELQSLLWLSPATALGPLIFFGFVHVRLDANAQYHRMVRDAEKVGVPDEQLLESQL